VALNVAEGGVKLKVLFEVLREEKLNLHRVLGPVVEDDPLPVELFVDEYVHVVLFFFYEDGHVYAGTGQLNWDWVRVVLVFKEDCELLLDFGELVRDECQLDFGFRVSLDLSCPFELDLGEKLFEFYLL